MFNINSTEGSTRLTKNLYMEKTSAGKQNLSKESKIIWNSDFPPKTGEWFLGLYSDVPFLMYYDWNPIQKIFGWVLSSINVMHFTEKEPDFWIKISYPKGLKEPWLS